MSSEPVQDRRCQGPRENRCGDQPNQASANAASTASNTQVAQPQRHGGHGVLVGNRTGRPAYWECRIRQNSRRNVGPQHRQGVGEPAPIGSSIGIISSPISFAKDTPITGAFCTQASPIILHDMQISRRNVEVCNEAHKKHIDRTIIGHTQELMFSDNVSVERESTLDTNNCQGPIGAKTSDTHLELSELRIQ